LQSKLKNINSRLVHLHFSNESQHVSSGSRDFFSTVFYEICMIQIKKSFLSQTNNYSSILVHTFLFRNHNRNHNRKYITSYFDQNLQKLIDTTSIHHIFILAKILSDIDLANRSRWEQTPKPLGQGFMHKRSQFIHYWRKEKILSCQ